LSDTQACSAGGTADSGASTVSFSIHGAGYPVAEDVALLPGSLLGSRIAEQGLYRRLIGSGERRHCLLSAALQSRTGQAETGKSADALDFNVPMESCP